MTPTCPWISLTPRMKADRVVVAGKQGQSGKMHPKNIAPCLPLSLNQDSNRNLNTRDLKGRVFCQSRVHVAVNPAVSKVAL